MSFTESLAQKIESTSLFFQGGVRRSILIFAGIVIILLAPGFFLGQAVGAYWSNLSINKDRIINKSIVNEKTLNQLDYTIERSQIVPLSYSGNVLYATINNRLNSDFGYYPFVYGVQILDAKNTIIDEKIQTSYLLPGDIKYIVASSGDERGASLRISTEPETQTVLYNPQAFNLSKRVNLEIRNPKVTDIEGQSDLVLSATIKNMDIVKIKVVDVMYIIRDDRDRVVGIGQYKIENLSSTEEREFNIKYPKPKYRRATRLDLRTFVNFLDNNNIILD